MTWSFFQIGVAFPPSLTALLIRSAHPIAKQDISPQQAACTNAQHDEPILSAFTTFSHMWFGFLLYGFHVHVMPAARHSIRVSRVSFRRYPTRPTLYFFPPLYTVLYFNVGLMLIKPAAENSLHSSSPLLNFAFAYCQNVK